MKLKMKKYPLLISMIVSCVIIIASLFILGFFGLKLGTSLGGGSQFEVNIANNASSKHYVNEIKDVLADNKLTFDSATVEDKYIAVDNEGNFTKQVVIVKVSQRNISDAKETAIIDEIAEKLSIEKSYISSIDNVVSSTTTKNVLMLGAAIGIVALALFIFAWIRYDILAGLSFIVAFLHNIILYFSMLILTRLELNLVSLTTMFVLTLVMSIVLIHIYEAYRKEDRLHISDNLSIPERMIGAEKQAIKPFAIVSVAVIVAAVVMLFIPATVAKFTALNILVALIVSAYTTLIIGPASYVALAEVRDVRKKAVLSRNDTVNKVIKKKIKNSKKVAAQKEEVKVEKTETVKAEQKEETVEKPVVEEKKVTKKTSTTTNKYATRKNTKKKK